VLVSKHQQAASIAAMPLHVDLYRVLVACHPTQRMLVYPLRPLVKHGRSKALLCQEGGQDQGAHPHTLHN